MLGNNKEKTLCYGKNPEQSWSGAKDIKTVDFLFSRLSLRNGNCELATKHPAIAKMYRVVHRRRHPPNGATTRKEMHRLNQPTLLASNWFQKRTDRFCLTILLILLFLIVFTFKLLCVSFIRALCALSFSSARSLLACVSS